MKTVCIVQARTTSTRLPMKIFADLGGRPMLAHVLERAAAIHGVDQVVLAVPENDVKLVSHLWPHVYGGSEKDVLSRYAEAALYYEADVIVRVTGDCCLLAPEILSWAVSEYHVGMCGYMPICQPYQPVADGWDGEVFSCNYLTHARDHAVKAQREHVTTYFRQNMTPCTPKLPFFDHDYTSMKISVDTREDLQRVEIIMNHLDDKKDFSHTATWQAWEKAGRP